MKSKNVENEDDSTSSDSYTEKVPSSAIIEKYNKTINIIKELNEKCKKYNNIILLYSQKFGKYTTKKTSS